MVRAHRHLLRHPRPRGARRGRACHPRRPRQHRRRRQRPDPARHLQRPAPRLPVRRQPVRRPAGRHAQRPVLRSGRRVPGRRWRGQHQPARRKRRSQPRLRFRVARAAGAGRLRGRDPDPVQEPALPERRTADLGDQRPASGEALRLPGLLGAGGARQRQLPRPVGRAGGAARPQPGHGDRADAHRHHALRRHARLQRPRLPRPLRARTQRALGRDPEPQPRRDGQPRLLPGRGRRRPGHDQRAVRAVLPREAAVLPRGARAVRLPQPADLHAPDREPRRGGQARGQGGRDERGHTARCGRDRAVRHGTPPAVRRHPPAWGPRPQLDARLRGDAARGWRRLLAARGPRPAARALAALLRAAPGRPVMDARGHGPRARAAVSGDVGPHRP